ncbi:MAG: rRNA maturation RNase YbeY [Nitrospirae bacterium]|nr:rRNA maturation RNase YbeY [Nitrospirota bacterium]
MKILLQNRQRRRPINKARIIKTARAILSFLEQPTAELSVLFVGDKKMTQLNAQYRGKNKSTDVLSFPQLSQKSEVRSQKWLLGDVVISIPRAEFQAKQYGGSFYDEMYRLLIHGILHLSGYDHEQSKHRAAMMRKKEQEIFDAVKKMG